MNNYTYIFCGSDMNSETHRATIRSDSFTFNAVGIMNLDDVVDVAESAVQAGALAIELCGAFSEEHVKRIKNFLGDAFPVSISHYY